MGRHSPRHGERIIAFRMMRPLQIEFFRSLLEALRKIVADCHLSAAESYW